MSQDKEMACRIDPDLENAGIQIDRFLPNCPAVLLTHAHMDHLKGITRWRGSGWKGLGWNACGKIFTTRVTCDLVRLCVKGLTEDRFEIIQYHVPFSPVSGVTVIAYPAYHCDGSCMFLCHLKSNTGDKLSILYTGDYRFHPDMRTFHYGPIDRLYYDDMFDEITVEYPSYLETVHAMEKLIKRLQVDYKKIYIHSLILGIEPILRDLATKLACTYHISSTLDDTWRGKQLRYLLQDSVDSTASDDIQAQSEKVQLILGNHKKDDFDDHKDRIPWIIPTCTSFLCPVPEQRPDHHSYVWFCTHSNQLENRRFQCLVNASSINPCLYNIGSLTCNF